MNGEAKFFYNICIVVMLAMNVVWHYLHCKQDETIKQLKKQIRRLKRRNK